MGLRFFVGQEAGTNTPYESVVLFDSVTETAFGHLIHGTDEFGAEEVAESFLVWAASCGYHDLRSVPVDTVCQLQDNFAALMRGEEIKAVGA